MANYLNTNDIPAWEMDEYLDVLGTRVWGEESPDVAIGTGSVVVCRPAKDDLDGWLTYANLVYDINCASHGAWLPPLKWTGIPMRDVSGSCRDAAAALGATWIETEDDGYWHIPGVEPWKAGKAVRDLEDATGGE